MNPNQSLKDRISKAELDLRALHEEACRLGVTLAELKILLKNEEAKASKEKIVEEVSPPVPTPPALPAVAKEVEESPVSVLTSPSIPHKSGFLDSAWVMSCCLTSPNSIPYHES
ncbi:MAG: hypothetical protein ACON4K_01725 [Akkermansiaceae bacterium]